MRCSVKTVERLSDAGKIEQKMRPRPGGSAIAVFNPRDVEQVAFQRAKAEGRTYVMPTEAETSETNSSPSLAASFNLPATVTLTTTAPTLFVEQLGAAIAQAFTGQQPEALEHRDILSLEEVRRLKGWPARFLMQLHRAGKLEFCAVPGRRGRMVRRRDLDELADIALPVWTAKKKPTPDEAA